MWSGRFRSRQRPTATHRTLELYNSACEHPKRQRPFQAALLWCRDLPVWSPCCPTYSGSGKSKRRWLRTSRRPTVNRTHLQKSRCFIASLGIWFRRVCEMWWYELVSDFSSVECRYERSKKFPPRLASRSLSAPWVRPSPDTHLWWGLREWLHMLSTTPRRSRPRQLNCSARNWCWSLRARLGLLTCNLRANRRARVLGRAHQTCSATRCRTASMSTSFRVNHSPSSLLMAKSRW
ncbi:hypothetical protein RFUL19S_04533 [Rhizobacter fulvus]